MQQLPTDKFFESVPSFVSPPHPSFSRSPGLPLATHTFFSLRARSVPTRQARSLPQSRVVAPATQAKPARVEFTATFALPPISSLMSVSSMRLFATAAAPAPATPAKAPRKKKEVDAKAPAAATPAKAKTPKPKVVKPAVELPPKPAVPGWGEDSHTPGNQSIKPVNKQMNELVVNGQVAEVLAIWDKMLKQDKSVPVPNLVTYNIMIKLYRSQSNFAEVTKLSQKRDETFHKKVVKGAATRTRLPRPYRPKPTSAPWALLVALRHADKTTPSAASIGLLKEQLILDAGKLADKDISFVTPDDYNGFYSGWQCMKTLIEKGLVERKTHGAKGVTFVITANGRTLADDLEKEWAEIQKNPAAAATAKA